MNQNLPPLPDAFPALHRDAPRTTSAWLPTAPPPAKSKPAPSIPLAAAASLQTADAAAALGMSVDSFVRYVAPNVTVIRRGSMRLYPVPALLRWRDDNAEAADAPAPPRRSRARKET